MIVREGSLAGAQPRFQSWGSNSLVYVIVQYRTKYRWYTSFVHCSLLRNGNHTPLFITLPKVKGLKQDDHKIL